MQIFDFDAHLPGERGPVPGSGPVGPSGPDRIPPPREYGFGRYQAIFAGGEGSPAQGVLPESKGDGTSRVEAQADELVSLMDSARVETSVLLVESNQVAVAAVNRYPNRLKGFAHIIPYDGMRGVREFQQLVQADGLCGLDVAALYDLIPASDRRLYPLYAKCVELGVPARIYTAMTYANDRPYDLGHPRHLDQVAVDFPELRIVADLSGWPWINDMVGLLRRHPNLYSSTGGHRPRHFGTPGSGWEQFVQFGNTLLQDRIIVGLSAKTLGMSRQQLIAEYRALPLKETVKEKWLYGNAAAFFAA